MPEAVTSSPAIAVVRQWLRVDTIHAHFIAAWSADPAAPPCIRNRFFPDSLQGLQESNFARCCQTNTDKGPLARYVKVQMSPISINRTMLQPIPSVAESTAHRTCKATQVLLTEGGKPKAVCASAVEAPRVTDVRAAVRELLAQGATSPRVIAQGLNQQGIGGPRGRQWSTSQVQAMLNRLRPVWKRRSK
jgi:hypothetical protein